MVDGHPHRWLLATSLVHGFLSVGHTAKGMDHFKDASFAQLPAQLRAAVVTGWYEGSLFFAVAGFLNWKWSQVGLVDTADVTMASLLTTLLVGAGANYFRTGDRPLGVLLVLSGILQGYGAKSAIS